MLAALGERPLRREPALLRERTFQMRFEGEGIAMTYLAGWPPLRRSLTQKVRLPE